MLCENVVNLVVAEGFRTDDSLEGEAILNVANLVEYLLHLLACREELLENLTFLYGNKVSVIPVLCLQVLLIVENYDWHIRNAAEADGIAWETLFPVFGCIGHTHLTKLLHILTC